jgi:hypothetical protein
MKAKKNVLLEPHHLRTREDQDVHDLDGLECQLCDQEAELEPGSFTPHQHAAIASDWRPAYEALGQILTLLEPLTPAAAARVLLVTILRFTPDAFSDAQLMELVQRAKEPQK